MLINIEYYRQVIKISHFENTEDRIIQLYLL